MHNDQAAQGVTMPDRVIGWWNDAASALGGLVLLGVLVRLYFHGEQVRKGLRRFWSWVLLLEIMAGVLLALVGAGIGEHAELGYLATAAVSVVLCFLGFYSLQLILLKVLQKKGLLPEDLDQLIELSNKRKD